MSYFAFADSFIGITLIAFLAGFVILGFFKGVFSIALNLVGILLAGLAGYFIYPHSSKLAEKVSEEPAIWLPLAIIGLVALVVFIVYKVLLSFLSKLVLGGEQGKGNKVTAALLALFGGAAFLWFGNNSLQQLNTAQFIENIQEQKNQKVEEKLIEVTSNQVQNFILSAQESWFGKFQTSFDPFQITLRCDTLRLISLEQQGVDFYRLGEEFDIFAYDTGFKRLVNDPEVQAALKKNDFLELFSLDSVKQFTKRNEVKTALEKIDWRKIKTR